QHVLLVAQSPDHNQDGTPLEGRAEARFTFGQRAWARVRSVMSLMNAWMTCRPLHSIRVSMTSIGIALPSGAQASQSNRALPLVMHSSICLRARASELSPL